MWIPRTYWSNLCICKGKKCKIDFINANYPKYLSQVDMYIVHDIYCTWSLQFTPYYQIRYQVAPTCLI